jgi:ubiquitin C-terminal hydrolase
MKFEKKLPIVEFVFFLCTNENKYNELLENFDVLFNNQNNNNHLELLYNLIIVESFVQDIEAIQLDLKEIFKENIKKDCVFNADNICQIASKKYMPFDDDNNLDKKKCFILNFIEKGGFEKIIKCIENILDSIENNNKDIEKMKFKCCQRGISIINTIYNSFTEKDKYEENNNTVDIYYLNNIIFKINDLIEKDSEENEENKENKENNGNKINKLKEIVINSCHENLVKTIISFLLKSKCNDLNESFCYCCFNFLINILTSNESLLMKIKKNDEIKNNILLLIKYEINIKDNQKKFFIESLNNYINIASEKNGNKLIYDFLLLLFDISSELFKEIVNNKNTINDKKENNISCTLFFDLYSNLFKVILNNKNIYNSLNNELIYQIYELVYKDIKEENKEAKLMEDTFLGFMKILITAIKNNESLKKEIISKKINNETLFDLIYEQIVNLMGNNYKSNDGDKDIKDLIIDIDKNKEDDDFIKTEKINELLKTLKNKNRNKKEDTISQKVYDIYNDFILICFNGSLDQKLFIKLLNIISFKNNSNNANYNKSKKEKNYKKLGYVGLKNIGCICYLNSILQQMYNVPSFRYAILSADDKEKENIQKSFFHGNYYDDNLLHQLQKMYTFLMYSEKQAYNPKDFVASFKDFDGAPTNPLIQQDSQEFFNNFCDKIENFLKKTKYKYIIDNIFTGKTCSSVICEKCHNVSNRFEDFYNLTLEVKNIGSLYESLEKLIVPEKIDEFNCEVCKNKVTISKRTSLAKLPNVLFVHLKRFYMDYEIERTEKINSRFEFPNTLNLKKYCIEEINKNDSTGNSYETDDIYPKEEEYYQYELKGINVHMGNAQGGHYISFIDIERDGHDNELNIKSSIVNNVFKSKWFKFNDANITEFDTKDIPIESYGGSIDNNSNNENIQNAYLLIYERKKKTPIKIIVDKNKINSIHDKDKNLDNKNIITFGKDKKASINKYYDISYSNKECRVKEEELYKLFFEEEETKECYVYIPYYNIKKTVLKKYLFEVIKKNNDFLNRKIIPTENPKYKNELNNILYSNHDFKLLNYNLSISDKKQIILFFKEQIFENDIFKNDNNEQHKKVFNKCANVLLENLIIPILNKKENKENKENEEEYNNLIKYISKFLFSNSILEKIFNENSAFDNKNIKIIYGIIYSILVHLKDKKDIINDLINIYKLVIEFDEDSSEYIINGNGFNDYDYEKKKKDRLLYIYYSYELIYKLIKIKFKYYILYFSTNFFHEKLLVLYK